MRQRDRLSDADARARMTAQWPLSRKRPLADVVIDNRGTPTELAQQITRYAQSPDGTIW